MATFIQIHTLTGFSSVLLNRDDSGMAKRIEYGNNVRTRTSSQFAKRKMRTSDSAASLLAVGDMSIRSRLVFRKKIAEPLIAEGNDPTAVIAVVMSIMDVMYKPSGKALKTRKKLAEAAISENVDPLDVLEREELLIFGNIEIDFVKDLARTVLASLDMSVLDHDKADEILLKQAEKEFKDRKLHETMKALPNSSLDIAAFGRMVTGDSLATVDAAVHVAHAISVHAQQSEVDYFVAVDDLKSRDTGDDAGSAHVGETEINSPLLYAYYVIDFDTLVGNLSGLDNAREVAAQVVARIAKLAATGIVGAKKGSTAPYASADFVFIEVGDDTPRSLAEAYRTPAAPTLVAAVDALTSYVKAKEGIYGKPDGRRFLMSITDAEIDGAEKLNFNEATEALKTLLIAE